MATHVPTTPPVTPEAPRRTLARASRCRRKPPQLSPVTMDLLGMAQDGALYLWEANAKVQPLDRFPMQGKRIVSGHYVIDVRGHAVTVHCGNAADEGFITLQFMCSAAPVEVVPAGYVRLLGQVIPDAEKQAEILAMLRRMTAEQVARQQAPHRKRGQA